MKQHLLFAGLASLLIVAGCHKPDETVVTGADGSKAVISGNTAGGQIDVTGKDGEHMKETVDNNGNAKFDITDKNGTKATESMDKNGGFKMSDSKGNNYQSGAGTVTESDLGLPFYPGSEESKDAGLSAIANDEKGKVVISYRSTKDDPDKVAAFYKDKIQDAKPTSMNSSGNKMDMMGGKLADGSEVSFMASNDGKTDTKIMVTVKTTKK